MELILTKDIQNGIRIYNNTPDAILIDVRDQEEYDKGHIPGSLNVPLNALIDDIYDVVPNMNSPVFLYCISGKRSVQAAMLLREMGYNNAASIGGIDDYRGEIKRV